MFKMKSTTNILTFVCLFAVFQLSHGLFCHSCKSMNERELGCKEIVDDRYLKLCKVGERCGEIFYLLSKAPSQVFRVCVTDQLLEIMRQNYLLMEKYGVKVGLYMCDTDGCNKRYNLKSMRVHRTLH